MSTTYISKFCYGMKSMSASSLCDEASSFIENVLSKNGKTNNEFSSPDDVAFEVSECLFGVCSSVIENKKLLFPFLTRLNEVSDIDLQWNLDNPSFAIEVSDFHSSLNYEEMSSLISELPLLMDAIFSLYSDNNSDFINSCKYFQYVDSF